MESKAKVLFYLARQDVNTSNRYKAFQLDMRCTHLLFIHTDQGYLEFTVSPK